MEAALSQQKTVISDGCVIKPIVLMRDEPSRALDLEAMMLPLLLKSKLVQSGVSIIMISSEAAELLGMSD